MRSIKAPDPSPPWLKAARHAYLSKRIWMSELAARICRTDSGTDFYYRVKAIGKRA